MAEGEPPLYHMRPVLRIMFTIAASPPPTLHESLRFSDLFNAFIARCLARDRSERPTAAALISDPFLLASATEGGLQELIDSAAAARASKLAADATEGGVGAQTAFAGTLKRGASPEQGASAAAEAGNANGGHAHFTATRSVYGDTFCTCSSHTPELRGESAASASQPSSIAALVASALGQGVPMGERGGGGRARAELAADGGDGTCVVHGTSAGEGEGTCVFHGRPCVAHGECDGGSNGGASNGALGHSGSACAAGGTCAGTCVVHAERGQPLLEAMVGSGRMKFLGGGGGGGNGAGAGGHTDASACEGTMLATLRLAPSAPPLDREGSRRALPRAQHRSSESLFIGTMDKRVAADDSDLLLVRKAQMVGIASAPGGIAWLAGTADDDAQGEEESSASGGTSIRQVAMTPAHVTLRRAHSDDALYERGSPHAIGEWQRRGEKLPRTPPPDAGSSTPRVAGPGGGLVRSQTAPPRAEEENGIDEHGCKTQ